MSLSTLYIHDLDMQGVLSVQPDPVLLFDFNSCSFITTCSWPLDQVLPPPNCHPPHRHRSRSKASTQPLNNSIIRRCILLPASVSACFPAPQPNGRTNLRRPHLSITTSASRGYSPPPSGCSRPRRTKWLKQGMAACTNGSANGAAGDSLCVAVSWQSTRACRLGETW